MKFFIYIFFQDELLELVNAAMVAANLNTSASKPALTVQINYEKAYGFMDFRTAEEATAAMTLDGIQVHGQPLRFRRPKDWTPQDSGTGNLILIVSTPLLPIFRYYSCCHSTRGGETYYF